MRHKRIAGAVAGLLAAITAYGVTTSYHLLSKTVLPGTGGWDYVTVDAGARKIYISHAQQVEVLDADTYQALGTIPNTPGVHGIAVAPELGRGFITAGKADAVIVFDLHTRNVISEVHVGKKPDAIVYDPFAKRVLAMNGDSHSATVINAKDASVAENIDLGGGPEFAVADGKGRVYLNLEDQSELLEIDTQAMKVTQRWPVAPCAQPSSLAMDTEKRRLFLGCRNHLMAVVNADSGKVVQSAPIGDHVDASAYDPATKMVFHSTGDGNVAVFHQESADAYTFLGNVATNPGSKTMALDVQTHHLIVPANQAGNFTILVYAQ
jgi:DNA-binding beta-propeller fold protein YncE